MKNSESISQLSQHPAGNVRFTFFDAVGLGKWAAPFLTLAEDFPLIVGPKAWTNARDAAARIDEITEEIAMLVQKRLGDRTLEEFNAQAGALAEPYRVLVFFGIPQDLPREACQKLIQLLQTGRRCGLRIMIAADQNQLPRDLPLTTDLFDLTVCKAENGNWFLPFDPINRFAFELAPMPSTEEITWQFQEIRKKLASIQAVKITMDSFLSPENFQTGNSTDGLKIYLGKTGDQKNRFLDLGRDGTTTHHGLIVGQSGSGKTVLLRTLVASGAWHYSPDELEFYLIDLKEGLGFKPFATDTGTLPHAKVVALKGEPELGLHVLQDLQLEMERRGDLFRQVGGGGLSNYRKQTGKQIPRILLVIDEFQRLFAEQATAGIASDFLSDFARRGREFGVHILLVTQSFDGMSSYMTQIQGQSGVRIALKCAEADAARVLHPQNVLAVRNLTRGGEAVYNDRSGEEAGNTTFQVAFMDPATELPAMVSKLAEQYLDRSPFVFDGTDANIGNNKALRTWLNQPFSSERPRPTKFLLGDSLVMSDGVIGGFTREPGKNLLVCGPSEGKALATMTSIVLGLAAQHDTSSLSTACAFTVLDCMGEGSQDFVGYWREVLKRVPFRPDHKHGLGSNRDTPKWLDNTETLLDTYINHVSEGKPNTHGFVPTATRYVILHGLQKARELRSDPKLQEMLKFLLKEGPEHGIHFIIWSDKTDSIKEALRTAIKEIDFRVTITQNEDEIRFLTASNKIPKVSGEHGLFINVEASTLEKFRLFDPMTPEQLNVFASKLQGRKASRPVLDA